MREYLSIFREQEIKTVLILWAIILTVLAIVTIPVAFWTQSNINWLLHISGSTNEIGFWLSWLATIVLNAIAIPLNILIEIIKLFY